jgi:hypothetical protein
MRDSQLQIPPEALSDEDAFEIMRLWAASGQLHTVISSDLQGGATDFGELLADLFEHAARMYSQRDGVALEESRKQMLNEFRRRLENPKSSIQGSIPIEH